jgi:uncharacterized repeat protein (TIGR01451 family)
VIVPVTIAGKINITKTANKSIAKCFEAVTYTYVVTNTGSAVLSNVVVTDDNGTANYDKDDVLVGQVASLAPGKSATFTRVLYLPISQYAVDEDGNANWSTLIPKCLPNGDLEFTFLQDDDLIDTTYGKKCSGGWKTQGGKDFYDDLGANYARFCFKDSRGNTVLDFDADYVSQSKKYPSGYGCAGIHNGWWGLHSAGGSGEGNNDQQGENNDQGENQNQISNITSTLSDDLNRSSKYYQCTQNSPDVTKDHNWESKSGYKVTVHPALFGWAGFGNLQISDVYNARCKNSDGGHFTPQPICGVVTNIAKVVATISGTCKTVTASAKASVTLDAPCQDTRQEKDHKCTHQHQCECTCGHCKAGDHSHCKNTKCQDEECRMQHCPWNV